MIVGPVGCGKSTLLHAILGEVRVIGGHISLSDSDIAFCDQNAWLKNTTVKESVVACSFYDRGWYDEVIEACDLMKEVCEMVAGHETSIGSNGNSLSGGQRHRLVCPWSLANIRGGN